MARPGSALKNIALVIVSVAVGLGVTLALDRLIVSSWLAPPPLPDSIELLFPPGSKHEHKTVDFHYVERINRLGLRDEEIATEPSDAVRILAIGDSYTFGWGVDLEDTWLNQLEENLEAAGHDVETINMGKPGAGPPDYAEFAETAIPLLEPDLVIVGMLLGNDLAAAGEEKSPSPGAAAASLMQWFYPNTMRWLRDLRRNRDFAGRTEEMTPPQTSTAEDNRRWKANRAKEFYDDNWSEEQRARFDALDTEVKEAFLSGNLNPYLIDLALQNPKFYEVTIDLEDPWTQTCIERVGSHLARVRHVAQQYDAKAVVVTIPEGVYVNEHALRNIRRIGYDVPGTLLESNAPDEGVRRASEAAGLPFHTVTGAFRSQRSNPEFFFELDGHLTAKGHAFYADAITPHIEPYVAGASE
ncbi:MAG: SGNH/GDSL hydrolase family protein [Candidatus Hydrogenedentota bacterium]